MRSQCSLLIMLGVIVFAAVMASPALAVHTISVNTCRDVSQPDIVPVGIQDEFDTGAMSIHAVAVLDQVKPGTEIKGIWVSVDAIKIANYQIDSTVVKAVAAETRAHFALSRPTSGWPTGRYKLDLYIDDKYVTSVPFSIVSVQDKEGTVSSKAPTEGKPRMKTTKGVASELIGTWQCRMPIGTSTLIFESDSKLSLDGEAARYRKVGGALRVTDESGSQDYPYVLNDNVLTVSFPEGYQMQFNKVSTETSHRGDFTGSEPGEADETEVVDDYRLDGNAEGNTALIQHFAGTWWNATTNTETNVTLMADGRYFENYTASYSGSSNDQYGNQTMAWGAAGDDQALGRWTVQGTREQGQLTIAYQNGNRRVIEYRVHIENGEAYWSEYYFNGELYGKK